MNVRVIANDDDEATATGPAAAPVTTDDELDDDNDPVSVGDRLRTALSGSAAKEPLYPRVLRLKHVSPNGWQRALLLEGMALAGALVALADKATAWAPIVLPAGAAAVVKFHDVLAGLLPPRPPRRAESPADPADAPDQ